MDIAKEVSKPQLIYSFVKTIFPAVKAQLSFWEEKAGRCPDRVLGEQALASIAHKEFHCLGGSIYSLYPGARVAEVIEFVVAYQTISDYLDNLVDALEIQDEQAFRQLHLAMTEALNADARCSDYYAYYPHREDGGYLAELVQTCQRRVQKLPSYEVVRPYMMKLAELYTLLQVSKHLHPAEREQKMLGWLEQVIPEYPGLSVWELAAATGSTLGTFCLFAMAYDAQLTDREAKKVRDAYFPWITGLHILLDYFIDLEEDRKTNQLNFVEYYASKKEQQERLLLFVETALSQARSLRYPDFHEAIIRGLLAMYLSDQKGKSRECGQVTAELIQAGGRPVKVLFWICLQLRKKGKL
ncbi:tetraprenyl-beta-curcumene synthase family protein [Desulfitobacterium hafniense]|uniref:tetraprenyl-beta-curcumene synthase family protein n=1 Tax=Desulfitobacterium hafniense TaxID=49338 RepID=UPI000369EF43|nr:tetraprenyl-beta-curcumene synthase family protein [Desulfitobacterium hafniense]